MKVMLVGDPGDQRTQLKAVLAALVEPQLEIIEGEAATAANLSENASAPPDATLAPTKFCSCRSTRARPPAPY